MSKPLFSLPASSNLIGSEVSSRKEVGTLFDQQEDAIDKKKVFVLKVLIALGLCNLLTTMAVIFFSGASLVSMKYREINKTEFSDIEAGDSIGESNDNDNLLLRQRTKADILRHGGNFHEYKYRGFVMMHTLKAGGNSVESMLGKYGFNLKERSQRQSIYVQQLGYIWFEDEADVDHWYPNFKKNHSILPAFSSFHRKEFFRIGMAREPCDYMVSVWAYSGRGNHGNLTGKCAGSAAIHNFSTFLHSSNFGWLTYRMASMLRKDGPPFIYKCPANQDTNSTYRIEETIRQLNATTAADCWVRTENMNSDLKRCMELYLKRRGGVSSLIIPTENKEKKTKSPKVNPGKHDSCQSYYSEAQARMAWEREAHFARQLGYQGCCRGLA